LKTRVRSLKWPHEGDKPIPDWRLHKSSVQGRYVNQRFPVEMCLIKRSRREWAAVNNPLLLVQFSSESLAFGSLLRQFRCSGLPFYLCFASGDIGLTAGNSRTPTRALIGFTRKIFLIRRSSLGREHPWVAAA
jgi:hypothetical protein